MDQVIIEKSLKTDAVRQHIPSIKVETPEQIADAIKIATYVRDWMNEHNGNFEGQHKSAYALHSAQIWHKFTSKLTDVPYNFFVVDKQLTTEEWGKKISEEDRSLRDITNIIFPDQIIFNPEIITATQTFMDDYRRKDGSYRKRATANVMRYPEACMSFNEYHWKVQKIDRFYRITVRYQVIDESGTGLKTIEESCQGLKSHIFQHEIDHADGICIVQKKHNTHWPTIEERERENGYTRKEVEEYTAQVLTDVEAKIQAQGVCLLQSVANGGYYRCPTTLAELPEGFIEPEVYQLYDWNTGEIKPPYHDAPWYTDSSAFLTEDELETLTPEHEQQK